MAMRPLPHTCILFIPKKIDLNSVEANFLPAMCMRCMDDSFKNNATELWGDSSCPGGPEPSGSGDR